MDSKELLESNLPDYMVESLNSYVNERRPVGSFLSCVLSNDLFGALMRADETNALLLRDYARYIYNYMPAACWGSEKAVSDWLSVEH